MATWAPYSRITTTTYPELPMYNLVGGLEHFLWLSIDWECRHPNWRTPWFFRGVGQPPTSIPMNFQRKVVNVATCWRLGTTHVCRSPKRQAGHFLHLTWSTSTRSHGLGQPGDKVVEDQVKVLPKPWRSELFDTFGVCVKIGATP